MPSLESFGSIFVRTGLSASGLWRVTLRAIEGMKFPYVRSKVGQLENELDHGFLLEWHEVLLASGFRFDGSAAARTRMDRGEGEIPIMCDSTQRPCYACCTTLRQS